MNLTPHSTRNRVWFLILNLKKTKTMESKELNLFEKLLEIQKRVVGLGEDKKSFGYKYVSGSKVLSHVKPLMNEYGILLKQEVTDIENTRQDYETKSKSKSEILTKALMKFTWVDVKTGEKDENLFAANGQNDWEKGLGSALTYAERYFLLKYFHISTDKDDIDNPDRKDNDVSQLTKPKAKPKNKTAVTNIKALKTALVGDIKDKAIKQLESQKYLTKEQVNDLVEEKLVNVKELSNVEIR